MTSLVSALTKLVAGAMLIGATTAQAAEIKVIESRTRFDPPRLN